MSGITSSIKKIKATVKNWWVFTLLGVLFIALGIVVFNNPVETYATLSVFFAASILVSGLFQSYFAVANRKLIEGWGWQLALGILEIVIGIVLFRDMNFTAAVFPFYVGFWLLFRAFALIGFSFELKSYYVMDWGYYLVFGISLAIFSWFIILNPVFGGMTIVTWTGIALVIAGIAYIMLSLKLRKVKNKAVDLKEAVMSKIVDAANEVEKFAKEAEKKAEEFKENLKSDMEETSSSTDEPKA